MNVYTKILYCDSGGSDKVYIVTVSQIANEYIVMTSWGARTASELTSKKKGAYEQEYRAIREAEKLVSKKRSDYRDAPKDLVIAGYKPSSVSTAFVLSDMSKKSDVAIGKAIPKGRNISL